MITSPSSVRNRMVRLLSQRLQVREHVVHVGIGVLAELVEVRRQWIVNSEFHLIGRKRSSHPRRVRHGYREFIS